MLMYLESFGNARKFTRLARRTAAVKPVVVVKGALHSGAVPAGHAVPVTRIPDSTVSALFRQAGVMRVDTVTELLDAGLFLALQPLPAGDRVAILGNSESIGLLTYDAALTAGLRPATPLDLTTGAYPEDFAAALTRAQADPDSDAVVVTAIPRVGSEDAPDPESGDDPALADALRRAATGAKPVVVVHLALDTMADRLGARDGGGTRVPAYRAPERAVRTLAEASAYAAWRAAAAAPGGFPDFDDIQQSAAADDVLRLLPADAPTRRETALSDADAATLLGRYGIRVRSALAAPDAGAAVAAAARLGYPVALKTTAPVCGTAPTSAAYASTSPTRPICGGPTTS